MALLAIVGPALADGAQIALPSPPPEEPELRLPRAGPHLQLLGAVSLGRGLRLNNPYRLATPLGDDAESLSLTATYLDLSASVSTGSPSGLAYGGAMHLSVAMDGIPQSVASPSFLCSLRLPPYFLVMGRLGLPIVLEPDANLGYELGVGAIYWLRAGVGLTTEVIGSLFYGAATQERAATTIPILSVQAGLAIGYEVLP